MADVAVADLRSAADQLRAAIESLDVPVTADDETSADVVDVEEAGGDELDAAVDGYLAKSDAVFDALVAVGDADATGQALGLVGADLTFVGGLFQAERGPDLTAAGADADTTTLAADLDDALDTVEHGRPVAVSLDAATASVDDVLAAIDKIVAAGAKSFGKVTAAAFVPSGEQVGTAVGALLGAGTGDIVTKVLGALGGFWKRVARAAARLLAKVLDRIARIFGKGAADDAKEWLEQLAETGNVLGVVLDVDEVKDRARDVVPTHPDRGAAAVAVVARHDGDQKWVGWGARVLGIAGGTALAVAEPWGPVLLGAVSLGLLALAVWLTQDHLDAPGLGFLPDRVDGVGAALGS